MLGTYGYPTFLNQISMFVLLDVLGGENPSVPSNFQTTHWAYQGMASAEQRLRNLGLMKTNPKTPFLPDSGKMASQFNGTSTLDDHVPFMSRGVPVMQIMPSPLPATYGTLGDDSEGLDPETIDDWSKIITAFAFEWLDMMEVVGGTKKKR